MTGILTSLLIIVGTAICAVISGQKGAPWCREYSSQISDPMPRHTWLLSNTSQAIVAALASGSALLWALLLGAPWEGALAAPVVTALCLNGSVDLVCHRLPDVLTTFAATFAIVGSTIRLALHPSLNALLAWLGATAAAFLVTLVLAMIGSGMGMGDVKLMGVIGLWLGTFSFFAPLWALIVGFLLAGPVALLLMVLRRMGRKQPMAFGPYLIAGSMAAWAVSIPFTA